MKNEEPLLILRDSPGIIFLRQLNPRLIAGVLVASQSPGGLLQSPACDP